MDRKTFIQKTEKGILLLDGATGSNLIKAGMPRGVCSEQWVLEHESVLIHLQEAYVESGSEVVYAPTFGANRQSLKNYGLEKEVREMNLRLVELSQRAVKGRAAIAGDLSTTGRALESGGGDMSVDELFDIYGEQIQAQKEAGVDLLIAETMLSVEETMVALDAANSVCPELPVMCSLTLAADGSAIYGGSGVEAVETLQEMGASAVGLNCSVGPDQLENVIRNMAAVAKVPVLAKPNAGMPVINEKGEAEYSMDARSFARHTVALADAGARVLGGCCGTTPEYIRAVRELLDRRGMLG